MPVMTSVQTGELRLGLLCSRYGINGQVSTTEPPDCVTVRRGYAVVTRKLSNVASPGTVEIPFAGRDQTDLTFGIEVVRVIR